MSFARRVIRKLGLYRDRFVYEVRRPELSEADVAARFAGLDPEDGADAGERGVLAAMLQRHLASTPEAPGWETHDAAEGDEIDTANIDWHLEPHFGVRWPRRFEGSLSDFHPGSDIVLLWHKNKMAFLLDLAWTYLSTREERLAVASYRAIDSWCRQNPYMVGKNWRSPMEVGTRLVVWSYALSMLREAPLPDEPTCARIIRSVIRQAEFLEGHFSHKEVPNNHLIGEAATLYVVATYWPMLRDSEEWRKKAEEILSNEVERQVLDDGFDYENSVNYHLYVIDFLLQYLHAKAVRGETPPEAVIDAAARMTDVALAVVSPSGRFPQIGDDSMSEFIALRPLRATAVRRAADLLRPGFAAPIAWTSWGGALMRRAVELENVHYFEDAGIAAIRGERSHATFVSGPQHQRPFSPGHLHLDSGSFELEVDGFPVFVDSGTHLYTYDLAARRHFKGASAHNTLLVDSREPVESDRVFGWDEVRAGRTVCFARFEAGTVVGCERDIPGASGTRFVHRRHFLEIEGTSGLWAVADTVTPVGQVEAEAGAEAEGHEASVLFHAALPASAVTVSGSRKLSLRLPGQAQELYVDIHSTRGHDVEIIDDPDDKRCWYSRWYGDLRRGVTIRTSAPAAPDCRILHVIRRADASVRVEGWDDGGVTLTVMSDGPARTITLDPNTGALAIDGRRVVPGSDGER